MLRRHGVGEVSADALVDWAEPDRWAAVVDTKLTLHATATQAMTLCETRLGPLHWEPRGPHAFTGRERK